MKDILQITTHLSYMKKIPLPTNHLTFFQEHTLQTASVIKLPYLDMDTSFVNRYLLSTMLALFQFKFSLSLDKPPGQTYNVHTNI